jgi:hypothetical protein
LERELGGVDDERIVRGFERGHFARLVRAIPCRLLCQDPLDRRLHTFGLEFEEAALGARPIRGRDEELHVRIWEHDRADVAAFEDGAARALARELALQVEELLADHGARRDLGGGQ